MTMTAPPTHTRMLVVDDDADINRLICLRLKAAGFQVQSVRDGADALAVLDKEPLDVLVLDVSMPGVGGIAVLEYVRARDMDVAVILSTAFGSEAIAIDALRKGADDYLRKPFERDEFHAVVERTVSRLLLRRQNIALQRQLDEKRRLLEAELARAGQVQADLLPLTLPRLPGFDLAAHCLPAHEVGGDFYDWQEVAPGTVALTVGDVMGKGMPAALLMATVRAALRAGTQPGRPAATVAAAAAALRDDFERSGRFVTLFRAVVTLPQRRLDYVDAGHGYALLRRRAGAVESLGPRNLPLGVEASVPPIPGALVLEPGDTLVIYSDGLPAAVAGTLDPSEIGRQLDGIGSAQEGVERLLALRTVEGPQDDDLTVVVLRCC